MSLHKIKFCGCKLCRKNRHKAGPKAELKKLSRGFRRKANQLTREGRDEDIGSSSAGYTD